MKYDDQKNKSVGIILNKGNSPERSFAYSSDLFECRANNRITREDEHDDFCSWAMKHLSTRLATIKRDQDSINPVLRDHILSNKELYFGKHASPNSLDHNSPKLFLHLNFSKHRLLSSNIPHLTEKTTAVNYAGPKQSQFSGYLCPGYAQNSILSGTWNSIMVKSTSLVLQRWSEVCSSSQSICCYWSGFESIYFQDPYSKGQNRLEVRSCSDQTQKFKVMKMNIILK